MKNLLFVILLLCAIRVSAQYDPDYKNKKEKVVNEEPSPVNCGLGLGLSYGGIGARVSVFPIHQVGIFGAVGYNLMKAGYNVGGIFRILPKQKICPVVMAMYGYNAVILISGTDQFNKTYYGPSFGGGMEIRFKNHQNYLNIETLIPIRSKQWENDIDVIRNLYNQNIIEGFTEPSPITICLGYHIRF
jgi:hypothetical protein